ncbi:mitochondrial 2-oxoglutarate/malate carrier protein-like [Schistocerca gregaria]|uniref:mitochondrial 2-oxoglutarate/malate carrier protein-like n=1 Tax=Schistocerca gregaria TaxID=7010 RepID=UPI00211DCBCC|nr:mitochondrial 2-oxoglutarate/malate carrier protein-like [Schistocerca gregaria]
MERRTKELPTVVRTGLFASSGVAVACALQPLDVVKIRLQTGMGGYRGAAHCAYSIVAHEGLTGLYAGTSAALLRHAIHAVGWVSAHSIFISTLTNQRPIGAAQRLLSGRGSMASMMGFHLQVNWPDTLHEHGVLRGFCYGAIVGVVAAIMSNPAEVAMVRMATDGMLRKSKRHHYRHVMDAMRRIRHEDGLRALWSGSLHSVVRTVLSLGVSMPFYAGMRSSLIASVTRER